MFNDQLLEALINNFYGYGNYQAPHWFIGVKEGGSDTHLEVGRRLEVWDSRGRRELENVAAYHRAMDMSDFFDHRPKSQPTWRRLIRIALTAQGQSCNPETICNYQQSKLGTEDGETCLLNLLPLPSPDKKPWLYAEHSTLPYLTSRPTYKKQVTSLRITHLQERITQYYPKAIVFHGLKYLAEWKKIAGVEFQEASAGINTASNGRTLFIAVKSPTARGLGNEYFQQVGKLIKIGNGD